MQDHSRHNHDIYAREGGPYADLIRELVESGRFESPSEVVLEGLALLRERELARKASQDWLRSEIQKGIDSADRGELIPAEEVFERLAAKYRTLAGGDGSL
jgi:antitoxin ParD1/3/4